MANKQSSVRWKIIIILLAVATLALILKLYDLTIKKGDYYRSLSENKRIKEVEITAPRGNIYDRNGVLLAGTRTSFAVRAYKDELSKLDLEKRNEIFYQMIHYVERDGADYLKPFPLTLNAVVFDQDRIYTIEDRTPDEVLEDRLVDYGLLGSWLTSIYQDPHDPDYRFSPAARALTAFSIKGNALPIRIDPDHDFRLSFIKDERYEKMVEQEIIRPTDSPAQALAKKLKSNRNILEQALNHPASRKLAFDLLKDKEDGIRGIKMVEKIYSYEDQFLQTKAGLHANFPDITRSSDAKSDFITIVENMALEDFLQSLSVDENKAFIIPAEKLINKLSALGIASNLKYVINEDASKVTIEFEKAEDSDEKPLDRLIRLAKENKLLPALITDDQCKSLAEQAMFSNGVYPGISTENWTYVLEKNQKDFIERYGLKGMNANQAFDRIKKDIGLPDDGSDLVNLGCMVINQEISNQGDYAFAPVNLCYELSEGTVALIEENIPNNAGIMVSREPIRYYPLGETACHILGYIGPIATEGELKRYVKEKKYLPNELIGKTGVEEAFEDTLHGVNGKEVVLVDKNGNRTETVSKEEAKPGNSVYLTADINLQKQSEKSLKTTILAIKNGRHYKSPWVNSSVIFSPSVSSGANISVDPNNGELLAMASYPTYDPNLFVTGISTSDWDNLQMKDYPGPDTPRPMMNLATQAAIQPGSTFKTIVSLAALEKGMTVQDTITCSGFITLAQTRFSCWVWNEQGHSHGPLNIYDALGVSCNYFFYCLGLGYDPNGHPMPKIQVTVEDLQDITHKLGLDKSSGLEINMPAESRNNIPSREGKLGMTKALLIDFLEENLEKYKREDVFKNQSELKADVKTISDWIDSEPDIDRQSLISRLSEMGYYPEKPQKGDRSGLADLIKYTYLNQAGWTEADSVNTMIGQGTNQYTPISMCKVASIIANQGTDYRLTLIKEIRSSDDQRVIFKQTPKGEPTGISKKSFETVTEGMRRSALDTYIILQKLPFEVATKTGTAEREGIDPQTGKRYAHYTWMIGFAPKDHPKIATCLFLPFGERSWSLSPMMADIFSSYLDAPVLHKTDDQEYKGLKTFYPERYKQTAQDQGDEGKEERRGSSEFEDSSTQSLENEVGGHGD